MNIIQQFEAEQIARLTAKAAPSPSSQPGDTVRVAVKVVEGERTRTQAFEGVCIARSNKGLNSNFTVRKISYGEGVERVFPLYSPTDRRDRGGAPRRRAPGQAVLPARPLRQVGPHRRARPRRPRRNRRRGPGHRTHRRRIGCGGPWYPLSVKRVSRRSRLSSRGA